MSAISKVNYQLLIILAAVIFCNSMSYGFDIYNGIKYEHQPELTKYGLKPILILYDDVFWNKGENRKELNVRKIVSEAKNIPAGSIVCIDIEHLDVGKLRQVAILIKKNAPNIKIGFYGIPAREYWTSLADKDSQEYRNWIKNNDQYAPLIKEVDVLFPSLYTFYPLPWQWERYAIENIRQAKKYGKPVYPFLWPQYHDSTILKGTYIYGDLWRLELETCYKYAEGLVIWGGWDLIAWKREEWKDDSTWWRVTKEFIQTKKLF
jgi:hypothetical protein